MSLAKCLLKPTIFLSFAMPQMASSTPIERYTQILKKATEPSEECDRRQAPQVLNLLTLLEQNRSELEKIQLPPGGKASLPVLRFESWTRAFQMQEQIQNTTPRSHPVEWFNLYSYSLNLLFHDQMRIVEGHNYQLDSSVAKFGPDAYSEVIRCLGVPNCHELSLPAEVKKMLSEKENYKYSWQAYLNGPSSETRTWLGLLEYHLSKDLSLLDFTINPTIRRVGQKLILPLDPGGFKNQKEKIEKSISRYWKNSRGQLVEVEWSQQDENSPETFKIIFSSEAISNAHVDSEQYLIFLDPTASEAEIAHEIGHALGFRDNYYRSWEADRCRYKDEFFLEDLMSAPETGKVTLEAWQTLEHYYPVAP